ncbi:hypothetical protein [Leucobacter luti]|uniref:hypothetical protein n=1 Tax=Leucobacter luti TaxID=340320 RepID=UPI001C68CA4C|nr:hypothetical protein [Leucobacter luti]QYM76317.1 hypothetical protein K1X41_02280 [Leucobacter luti]
MTEITPTKKRASGRKRAMVTGAIALTIASAATFAAFQDAAWLNFGNGDKGFSTAKEVDIQVIKTDNQGNPVKATFAQATSNTDWQESDIKGAAAYINFDGLQSLVPGDAVNMSIPFRQALNSTTTHGPSKITWAIEETPGKETANGTTNATLLNALRFQIPGGNWKTWAAFNGEVTNGLEGNRWNPGEGGDLKINVKIEDGTPAASIRGMNVHLQVAFDSTVAN